MKFDMETSQFQPQVRRSQVEVSRDNWLGGQNFPVEQEQLREFNSKLRQMSSEDVQSLNEGYKLQLKSLSRAIDDFFKHT